MIDVGGEKNPHANNRGGGGRKQGSWRMPNRSVYIHVLAAEVRGLKNTSRMYGTSIQIKLFCNFSSQRQLCTGKYT